jgi:hypothetical protein
VPLLLTRFRLLVNVPYLGFLGAVVFSMRRLKCIEAQLAQQWNPQSFWQQVNVRLSGRCVPSHLSLLLVVAWVVEHLPTH